MTLVEKINALKQEREVLHQANNDLLDRAGEETRSDTVEVTEEFNKRYADVEAMDGRIELLEKQEAQSRELELRDATPATPNREDRQVSSAGEWRSEFHSEFDRDPANEERSTPEYTAAFHAYISADTDSEARALQADLNASGGYTYTDEQFNARLIQDLDESVIVRRFATVETVSNADSLGFPSLDNDPADSAWTTELQTGDEDSTMDFGKRSLTPHPFAKRLKVSETLLRKSALGIERLVRERLGYKFAVTEEQAYMTGSGSQRPLGIFTASDNGIPTGRDDTTATAGTIVPDEIINLLYDNFTAAWLESDNLRFFLHRNTKKVLVKLKDGEGNYLWRNSLSSGEPNRLMDRPVHMSEYAPSGTGSGTYAMCVGNFQFYWIADALTFRLKRLNELYAETDQVGFIGRKETDGMPVLSTAFARLAYL